MVPAPSHNKIAQKCQKDAQKMLDYAQERTQMSPKQTRFISEFLIDTNGTKAAERAGYSVKSAAAQAHRLMRNAKIREEISARQQVLLAKNEITAAAVLKELAKVAFFDDRVSDVSSLSNQVDSNHKHGVGLFNEMKMADKLRALELLGKH